MHAQKPKWLTRRLPSGPAYEKTRASLSKSRLHTVCQEAHCPNLWECFSSKTATFLIMGRVVLETFREVRATRLFTDGVEGLRPHQGSNRDAVRARTGLLAQELRQA